MSKRGRTSPTSGAQAGGASPAAVTPGGSLGLIGTATTAILSNPTPVRTPSATVVSPTAGASGTPGSAYTPIPIATGASGQPPWHGSPVWWVFTQYVEPLVGGLKASPSGLPESHKSLGRAVIDGVTVTTQRFAMCTIGYCHRDKCKVGPLNGSTTSQLWCHLQVYHKPIYGLLKAASTLRQTNGPDMQQREEIWRQVQSIIAASRDASAAGMDMSEASTDDEGITPAAAVVTAGRIRDADADGTDDGDMDKRMPKPKVRRIRAPKSAGGAAAVAAMTAASTTAVGTLTGVGAAVEAFSPPPALTRYRAWRLLVRNLSATAMSMDPDLQALVSMGRGAYFASQEFRSMCLNQVNQATLSLRDLWGRVEGVALTFDQYQSTFVPDNVIVSVHYWSPEDAAQLVSRPVLFLPNYSARETELSAAISEACNSGVIPREKVIAVTLNGSSRFKAVVEQYCAETFPGVRGRILRCRIQALQNVLRSALAKLPGSHAVNVSFDKVANTLRYFQENDKAFAKLITATAQVGISVNDLSRSHTGSLYSMVDRFLALLPAIQHAFVDAATVREQLPELPRDSEVALLAALRRVLQPIDCLLNLCNQESVPSIAYWNVLSLNLADCLTAWDALLGAGTRSAEEPEFSALMNQGPAIVAALQAFLQSLVADLRVDCAGAAHPVFDALCLSSTAATTRNVEAERVLLHAAKELGLAADLVVPAPATVVAEQKDSELIAGLRKLPDYVVTALNHTETTPVEAGRGDQLAAAIAAELKLFNQLRSLFKCFGPDPVPSDAIRWWQDHAAGLPHLYKIFRAFGVWQSSCSAGEHQLGEIMSLTHLPRPYMSQHLFLRANLDLIDAVTLPQLSPPSDGWEDCQFMVAESWNSWRHTSV